MSLSRLALWSTASRSSVPGSLRSQVGDHLEVHGAQGQREGLQGRQGPLKVQGEAVLPDPSKLHQNGLLGVRLHELEVLHRRHGHAAIEVQHECLSLRVPLGLLVDELNQLPPQGRTPIYRVHHGAVRVRGRAPLLHAAAVGHPR
eukprot:scaffold330_cov246-Pinguiococcus_pyrenoidosus.AAC.23